MTCLNWTNVISRREGVMLSEWLRNDIRLWGWHLIGFDRLFIMKIRDIRRPLWNFNIHIIAGNVKMDVDKVSMLNLWSREISCQTNLLQYVYRKCMSFLKWIILCIGSLWLYLALHFLQWILYNWKYMFHSTIFIIGLRNSLFMIRNKRSSVLICIDFGFAITIKCQKHWITLNAKISLQIISQTC